MLTAALLLGSATYANTTTANAADFPAPKYNFNMDKTNKNVVAVARKGDNKNHTTGKPETGVLPKASQAKKVKLKYVKGKKGKALYLNGSSYGAELNKVKLGTGPWTVSFWVKADDSISDYVPIFFTGNKITDPRNTHWVSITHMTGHDYGGDPYIWSHRVTGDGMEEFPWYCCQDADGNLIESSALTKDKWVHITLVVDTNDTYGEELKGHHGWTYVNGELYGSGTVANNTMTNSNKFYLGINAWDVPFKGCYDEVKLWNKALTDKQVAALYNSEK